jgi:hypothetical protein
VVLIPSTENTAMLAIPSKATENFLTIDYLHPRIYCTRCKAERRRVFPVAAKRPLEATDLQGPKLS